MILKTFWWRGTPNFGDVLARDIVGLLTPHVARWDTPRRAQFAVTGSIVTMLPVDWGGTALGIGYARPHVGLLRHARVLALRGNLSANEYGRPVPVRGDPGLLSPYLVPPAEPDIDMVVVPHWNDHTLRWRYPKAVLVNVRGEPLDVIAQIRRARRVIASSLHGIIVADAYGIERRWETFDGVQGGGFKFRDHGSVVGKFEPGEWGRASGYAVSNAQSALLDLVRSL